MKSVIRNILLILNIAAIAALWACCVSTMLHPEYHPRLAIMGLAFPFVLVLNTCFILPWLFVRKRWMLLPVVGIGICYSFVLDYFPLNQPQDVPEDALKVVTWNCKGFGYTKNQELADKHFADCVDYLSTCQADIICMQEVSPMSSQRTISLLDTLSCLGYKSMENGGRLILTRLDTLSTQVLPQETRGGNGTFMAKVVCGNDTLIILNNHLESNSLSPGILADYADAIHNPNELAIKNVGLTMVENLEDAVSVRSRQADRLTHYLDSLPQSCNVILCGDFNDTPISYCYQEIAVRLKSAFRESGRGLGISYRMKKFPVRIDHMFVSHDWQSYNAQINRKIEASDHFPVEVWVKKCKK